MKVILSLLLAMISIKAYSKNDAFNVVEVLAPGNHFTGSGPVMPRAEARPTLKKVEKVVVDAQDIRQLTAVLAFHGKTVENSGFGGPARFYTGLVRCMKIKKSIPNDFVCFINHKELEISNTTAEHIFKLAEKYHTRFGIVKEFDDYMLEDLKCFPPTTSFPEGTCTYSILVPNEN